MAGITVRNLEEGLKRQLRLQAAENGRSMEEEARVILRTALYNQPRPSIKGNQEQGGYSSYKVILS